MTSALTRRNFLQRSFVASSALLVVPAHVLGRQGKAPSATLNIAAVGIGGQGSHDLQQLSSENIVALCDVDTSYAAPIFKRYPDAKVYSDFRKMLEEQKDIDAVVVATPDHLHAYVSITAMR